MSKTAQKKTKSEKFTHKILLTEESAGLKNPTAGP